MFKGNYLKINKICILKSIERDPNTANQWSICDTVKGNVTPQCCSTRGLAIPRENNMSAVPVETMMLGMFSSIWTEVWYTWEKSENEGLGKRGHIVADTNVSPFGRSRNICCEHKFCVRDTKNVSDFVQKHFVSATNVSQFAHPRNIMSNNVSATMCPRLPGP